MQMTPAHLLTAINDAGCPAVSSAVLDAADRATWSYTPTEQATPEQIAIGDNVIATIPMEIGDILTVDVFIGRWTNAEYLKLEQKRAADIGNAKVGNAKNWDQVMMSGAIDPNKKKVQTLKDDLVTSAILTQARADEIFS